MDEQSVPSFTSYDVTARRTYEDIQAPQTYISPLSSLEVKVRLCDLREVKLAFHIT